MARKYDIVSRSRNVTVLSVIVGYETKTGKPALKNIEATVPFYVAKDNKRDYALAEKYLQENGNIAGVKMVDGVRRYIVIRYEMPFSEFAEQATKTERETKNPKTKTKHD